MEHPPPSSIGMSVITHYFELGRFDDPEYYLDDAEDSEEEVTNRARSGRKSVPPLEILNNMLLPRLRCAMRQDSLLLSSGWRGWYQHL